jgi:hypothetical protein
LTIHRLLSSQSSIRTVLMSRQACTEIYIIQESHRPSVNPGSPRCKWNILHSSCHTQEGSNQACIGRIEYHCDCQHNNCNYRNVLQLDNNTLTKTDSTKCPPSFFRTLRTPGELYFILGAVFDKTPPIAIWGDQITSCQATDDYR